MSDKRNVEMAAVSFSERLASSQHFAALFRDGMALVDETASYLDGPGRLESLCAAHSKSVRSRMSRDELPTKMRCVPGVLTQSLRCSS